MQRGTRPFDLRAEVRERERLRRGGRGAVVKKARRTAGQAPAGLRGWMPAAFMGLLVLGLGAYAGVAEEAFLTEFNLRSLLLTAMPLALAAIGQTNALLVALSVRFGDDGYDEEAAAAAFAALADEGIAGSGPDGTIGDLDFGRIRELLKTAVPAWQTAGRAVPSGVAVSPGQGADLARCLQ